MPETRPTDQRGAGFTSMPRSLGRGGREDIVWEALERVDGKPAPAIGVMQAAMGTEAQIRLTQDVIRAYLDTQGLRDTGEWAARRGGVA
ncbi:hypothetical protein [Microbacterium paraoxydans]|uniref:hypothetical protein n=1 Tax=Microbacterium paraoxydans TaxID=199592 RepID=UPI003013C326